MRDGYLWPSWPNTISALHLDPQDVSPELCQSPSLWWPCGSPSWMLDLIQYIRLIAWLDLIDVPLPTPERYCSQMGAVLLKTESCMQQQWWWTKIRLSGHTVFKHGNLGSGIWAFIIDLSILLKGRHDYDHMHWQQQIWFHRGSCPQGCIQGKRIVNPRRKRNIKQKRNLNPIGNHLLTQEGHHYALQRTPKKGGFLWSQKQWNSWLGSLGSGLRTSGTSWSLNSPARTQITGPPGTPQGILTGSNKNWPHELTQDEGCCQMSDTSSHMSGKEAGYRSPPSHWSREHKTELVRLRYFIPNLNNVIKNTHFWMFHLCPGKP